MSLDLLKLPDVIQKVLNEALDWSSNYILSFYILRIVMLISESNIIILNLTKKEFMEEREELAKKNLYLSAKYKCKDCVKGFIYKEIYDKHMKLHLKV